jgi:hypothetical protein
MVLTRQWPSASVPAAVSVLVSFAVHDSGPIRSATD